MKFRLFLTALIVGCFGVQPLSAADQKYTGNTPSAVIGASTDNGKILYLYNLGQKKFLDQGGIWGTQVHLGNGLPFWLQASGSTYLIKTSSKTTGYNGLAIVTGSGHITDAQNQVFVDQLSNANSNTTTTCYGNFSFNSVSSSDYTNAYTISIRFNSSTYYLVANADNTVTTTTTAPTTADGYWVLVTKQNLLDEFSSASGIGAQSVECSFVIDNPGFKREGTASSWTGGSSVLTNGSSITRPKANDKYYIYGHGTSYTTGESHSFVSFKDLGESVTINCDDNTYSSFTTKTEKTEGTKSTYYIGNGYSGSSKIAYKDNEPADSTKYSKITQAQAVYGGDWTANIHGASGKVYQTKTVTIAAGRYMIKAEGFSTDGTGYLFAQAGSETTNGDKFQKIAFQTVTERPETYVQAAKLINKGGYEKNVVVTVDKNETLTFGVVVESGTTDSWTCFDNFSLQYLGPDNGNIILDEEQTSAEYINKQVDTEKNHRLCLKRSFKPGVWNSVVLPVTLSSGQVKGAFGGDQVLVSALTSTGHDGRQIYFEPVDMNSNPKAIEAGKVYIIKPQTAMPTGLGEVKSYKDGVDVTLTGSYYTIDQVTMNAAVPTDGQVVPSAVVESQYDNGIKHCGSYVMVDKSSTKEFAIPASTYVLSGGKWYYNEGTGIYKVKGFRGWIATEQSQSEAKETTFFINGIADDVTAIEGITVERPVKQMMQGVYSLSGQKLSDGTSLEGLPAGIYIVGGQKHVVR